MSNVYILEPPTTGKVLLKTTVGEIDIELWAKETPKTCRNFIQLCMEGYYNGTIFHRVVKGFIAQGGDPLGDGTGGESIYGGTFKDEFHQRLRFARRGLLAMANAGPDDNASQFFFTLAAAPELQNKHTIFGKVTGETLFNMLKLEEGLIEDERPVYPHKILKTEVLHNPFPDIEPRILEPVVKESKKKKKDKTPGVKNFKLLSFGAEAEEDEEESSKVNVKYAGKGKSTHDVLDDPKLSSQTLDQPDTSKSDKKEKDNEDDDDDSEESDSPEVRLENIRKKLKLDKKEKKPAPIITPSYYDEDEKDKRKRKYEEIQKEIESVKREYHKNKLKRTEEKEEEKKELELQDTFKEYKDEYKKYKTKTKELPKKGAGREAFTLELLSKFKKKLTSAIDSKENNDDQQESDEDDIDNDENWLAHKLHFKDDTPVLAKDANTKDDDWFEIYDPRNPLNKRRRGDAPTKSTRK